FASTPPAGPRVRLLGSAMSKRFPLQPRPRKSEREGSSSYLPNSASVSPGPFICPKQPRQRPARHSCARTRYTRATDLSHPSAHFGRFGEPQHLCRLVGVRENCWRCPCPGGCPPARPHAPPRP